MYNRYYNVRKTNCRTGHNQMAVSLGIAGSIIAHDDNVYRLFFEMCTY